jgi:hypothetical protein
MCESLTICDYYHPLINQKKWTLQGVTVTKFNALRVSPSDACMRDQQGNVQHLVYVMINSTKLKGKN